MTETIKKHIEVKNIDIAKDLISKSILDKDFATWKEQKEAEYNSLFPPQREMTEGEKVSFYNSLESDKPIYSEMVFPFVKIDYSNNESYMDFDDWLSETIVVQEEIQEISHVEIIEGVETKIIDVPFQEEKIELVRPYIPAEVTEEQILSKMIEFSNIESVSMRQCRIALLNIGLLTTVQNAIETGEDEALKIEWEYSLEVKRGWESLINLADSLGLTSEDLDKLFFEASLL